MAVKKANFLRRLNSDQIVECVCFERSIDRTLNSYVGNKFINGNRVVVAVNELPSEKVKKELERLYVEAGWEIEFKENHPAIGGPVIELR